MCLTVCSNVNCLLWSAEYRENEKKRKRVNGTTFCKGSTAHTKKSTTSTKTLDANDFNVFAKYIMLSLFSKSMSEKEALSTCILLTLSPFTIHWWIWHEHIYSQFLPLARARTAKVEPYSYYVITSKQIVGSALLSSSNRKQFRKLNQYQYYI